MIALCNLNYTLRYTIAVCEMFHQLINLQAIVVMLCLTVTCPLPALRPLFIILLSSIILTSQLNFTVPSSNNVRRYHNYCGLIIKTPGS